MAVPPLASIAALQSWLGIASFDDAAEARAELALDAASAMVRAEAGRTWITDDELDDPLPGDVVAVVLRVAANIWANPTGVSQRSAGPYSESYGDSLTAEDRTTLNRYRGTGGVWSLGTTRSDDDVPDIWVDVVGSDDPLPVPLPPW